MGDLGTIGLFVTHFDRTGRWIDLIARSCPTTTTTTTPTTNPQPPPPTPHPHQPPTTTTTTPPPPPPPPPTPPPPPHHHHHHPHHPTPPHHHPHHHHPNPQSRSKNTKQQNGKNMNGNTNVLPPVKVAVVYMKCILIWSWKVIANLPKMGEIAELRSIATTSLRMRPQSFYIHVCCC